jgi:hypothetical protein
LSSFRVAVAFEKYRRASGRYGKLPSIASELVSKQVAMIAAIGADQNQGRKPNGRPEV